ncbi:MAG TPA: helix-turn-helix transcriptional regulator [Actinomycetaceae bacterium]|nr:helix-turn-helix transcriptional regulator [Actinomycetaceae bacterium]
MAAVRQVTTLTLDRPRVRQGPPLFREAVGRVLREERTAREERLVDVAREAAISPQYLSEVERGAKDPSSEVLRAVSGALDLPAAEVVRRASTLMASPARRQGPTVSAPTALRLAA